MITESKKAQIINTARNNPLFTHRAVAEHCSVSLSVASPVISRAKKTFGDDFYFSKTVRRPTCHADLVFACFQGAKGKPVTMVSLIATTGLRYNQVYAAWKYLCSTRKENVTRIKKGGSECFIYKGKLVDSGPKPKMMFRELFKLMNRLEAA